MSGGDFETPDPGWVALPGSFLYSYATGPVLSGSRSLELGPAAGFNMAATMGVAQVVSVPAAAEAVDLVIHYYAQAEGEISAGDRAILTVYDTAIDQPVTTILLANDTARSWTMEQRDLANLAGREIRISLAVFNDGEPGRLVLYADDLSLRACGAGLSAPDPTRSVPGAITQTGVLSSGSGPKIASLAECTCTADSYACSDFSSWSVAQACFTSCQVTAGFDIHGLDPDRNGIACELELQDITLTNAPITASVDLPSSELPLPVVTTSPVMTTAAALTATGVVTVAGVTQAPGQVTETISAARVASDVVTTIPRAPAAVASLPAADSTLGQPALPGLAGTSPMLLVGAGVGIGALVLLLGGLLGLWLARMAGKGQRRE
jgi:hypothetical protein